MKSNPRPPIAVWPVCLNIGLYLVEIDDNIAIWRWSNENRIHKSKVNVDAKTNRMYICANRAKYWLDKARSIKRRA